MAKKLDRKRDFGEIMGHEGGACFIQDDTLFDAEGNELVTGKPKAAAKPKVVDQVAEQLDGTPSDFAA
jgi:hypothetical protein